jgi:hypothetical protein
MLQEAKRITTKVEIIKRALKNLQEKEILEVQVEKKKERGGTKIIGKRKEKIGRWRKNKRRGRKEKKGRRT